MKFSEIQDKTKDELAKMIKEKRSELIALRFDFAVKKIKDATKMRKIKKDIARILTAVKSAK